MTTTDGRARHALRCRRCRSFKSRDGACIRCDEGAPKLLPPMSYKLKRNCVYCGRPFEVYAASRKMTCSARCNSRRWRAYRRLAASTPTDV